MVCRLTVRLGFAASHIFAKAWQAHVTLMGDKTFSAAAYRQWLDTYPDQIAQLVTQVAP